MKSADYRWRQLNNKLIKYMKESDFYRLAATYYEMADFIAKEGKNPDEYKQLGYEIKRKMQEEMLEKYRLSEVVISVRVLAAGNGTECQYCHDLSGTTVGLKDAKNKSLLPEKNCQHLHGCRCVYLPVTEDTA